MFRSLVAAALLAMTIIAACPSAVKAQGRDDREDLGKESIESVKTRPELGAEYSSVARFKIASRKQTYHLGEMISLDLAMLNLSKERILFYPLSAARFYIQDEKGEELRFVPYVVTAKSIGPDGYALVEANNMVADSFSVIAGCDRRAFDKIGSAKADVDDLSVFEANRFVNWGQACLDTLSPGTYVIWAEIQNTYVIAASDKNSPKTAVGKIRSNSLEITIVK
jgi:hypothetical protein